MAFCLLAGTAHSQTSEASQTSEIRLRVTHSTDKKVKVFEPVNGTVFWSNPKIKYLEDSSNTVGKATIRIRFGKPGPVSLLAGGVSVLLFVRPGDRIAVDIDPTDTISRLRFGGNNAAGQLKLNEKTGYYGFEANDYLKKDTVTGYALQKVRADLDADTRSLMTLYEFRKIDKSFLDYAILNSRYRHAAIMAAIVKSKYDATTYPKKSPDYRPVFKQSDADEWKKIYEEVPVNNIRAMSTFTYAEYLADYVQNYVNRYEAEKKGTYKQLGADYVTPLYDYYNKAPVQASIREYGLANFIQLESMQESYDPKLLALYKRFSGQFPKNPYSVSLKPMMEPILAFQAKEKASFTASQKIFTHYDQVDSLAQLLQTFKGNTVFVDIWATWCGPCKEEFQYGAGLRKFLHDQGVTLLYIALDNDKADTHWRTMIKYYNLAGTHVRANPAFQNELISRRGVGSIPRYLIIDKSGNIAEANALRPSDKEKLYEQIQKYL